VSSPLLSQREVSDGSGSQKQNDQEQRRSSSWRGRHIARLIGAPAAAVLLSYTMMDSMGRNGAAQAAEEPAGNSNANASVWPAESIRKRSQELFALLQSSPDVPKEALRSVQDLPHLSDHSFRLPYPLRGSISTVIDHTLLKQDAKASDVAKLCQVTRNNSNLKNGYMAM